MADSYGYLGDYTNPFNLDPISQASTQANTDANNLLQRGNASQQALLLSGLLGRGGSGSSSGANLGGLASLLGSTSSSGGGSADTQGGIGLGDLLSAGAVNNPYSPAFDPGNASGSLGASSGLTGSQYKGLGTLDQGVNMLGAATGNTGLMQAASAGGDALGLYGAYTGLTSGNLNGEISGGLTGASTLNNILSQTGAIGQGTASTLGGVLGGLGAAYSGYQLYNNYATNSPSQDASQASNVGAGIGGLLGGPLGAIAGKGVGYLAGLIIGNVSPGSQSLYNQNTANNFLSGISQQASANIGQDGGPNSPTPWTTDWQNPTMPSLNDLSNQVDQALQQQQQNMNMDDYISPQDDPNRYGGLDGFNSFDADDQH